MATEGDGGRGGLRKMEEGDRVCHILRHDDEHPAWLTLSFVIKSLRWFNADLLTPTEEICSLSAPGINDSIKRGPLPLVLAKGGRGREAGGVMKQGERMSFHEAGLMDSSDGEEFCYLPLGGDMTMCFQFSGWSAHCRSTAPAAPHAQSTLSG
ncbi:unnamed protein product [Pleuronectes platessa]|uniref:Uncharacterized protein n=1 Tax=Pleuronectes platessa TaxID=8262 RepID=A0A9N7VK06_PLEPL|nr:unnamed protein product [Pleuronectes platessa]